MAPLPARSAYARAAPPAGASGPGMPPSPPPSTRGRADAEPGPLSRSFP